MEELWVLLQYAIQAVSRLGLGQQEVCKGDPRSTIYMKERLTWKTKAIGGGGPYIIFGPPRLYRFFYKTFLISWVLGHKIIRGVNKSSFYHQESTGFLDYLIDFLNNIFMISWVLGHNLGLRATRESNVNELANNPDRRAKRAHRT